MIKKTITSTDFTGEELTEDFYFNLTEAELIELEVSAEGNSLSAWLEKIGRNLQGDKLIAAFKLIIGQAYGVKSTDGRRFVKSPEILAEFRSTMAYSSLFMELATNAESAAEFVNGLMPKGMAPGQSATQNAGLSPSEAARKASEARMQGRQKPQEKVVPTVEKQPELPTELATAQPVFEPEDQPVTQEAAAPVVDLNSMSSDDLHAYVLAQQKG